MNFFYKFKETIPAYWLGVRMLISMLKRCEERMFAHNLDPNIKNLYTGPLGESK
jgi:hypothetical protein